MRPRRTPGSHPGPVTAVFPGTRTRSDRCRSATASSSTPSHAVTRCPHSTWPQRLVGSRPSVRVLYYAAVLLLHNNCGRYPAALAAARSAANYEPGACKYAKRRRDLGRLLSQATGLSNVRLAWATATDLPAPAVAVTATTR